MDPFMDTNYEVAHILLEFASGSVGQSQQLLQPAPRNPPPAGNAPSNNDGVGHFAPQRSRGWQAHDDEQQGSLAGSNADHDMLATDQANDQRDDGKQGNSDVEMGLDNDTIEGQNSKLQKKKPMISGNIEYTMVQDDVGKKWYCEKGKARQETVFHYDIRSILLDEAEQSNPGGASKSTLSTLRTPLILLDFIPKQGPRSDDRTAFHEAYNFDGKIRLFRPDSLFVFRRYTPTHDLRPSSFLEWNGKIVLDYRGLLMPNYELPVTISSKIEEPRLEAMRRSNSHITFDDILGRILRPSLNSTQVRNCKNRLSGAGRRWRNLARLTAFNPKKGSYTYTAYLQSIMSAEMIAKNATRGLVDLVNGSEEADYMMMLNLGSAKENGRKKGGNGKRREQETNIIRRGAYEWAQHRITWEVQNPITNLSTRVPLAVDSVESIVAWKLASLNQHCADTRLAHPSLLTLPNSPPAFPLGDDKFDAFFGGENGQTEDHDDPVVQLDRIPMRWNTFSIPKLTVVEEYKERSIETLATWQRAWARIQRIRLSLQVDDQDGEGDGVIGDKESQEGGGEGDSRGTEDEEEEEEEEKEGE
ncbi:MAG: hypothetical protein Q9175_005286 [Cornicularia normoerica]